jgi:hypothetical protein
MNLTASIHNGRRLTQGEVWAEVKCQFCGRDHQLVVTSGVKRGTVLRPKDLVTPAGKDWAFCAGCTKTGGMLVLRTGFDPPERQAPKWKNVTSMFM